MRLSWNALSLPVFSQHSLLPYVLDDYSSVVLGTLFLHTALLTDLVITCGSPVISLRSFLFAETFSSG